MAARTQAHRGHTLSLRGLTSGRRAAVCADCRRDALLCASPSLPPVLCEREDRGQRVSARSVTVPGRGPRLRRGKRRAGWDSAPDRTCAGKHGQRTGSWLVTAVTGSRRAGWPAGDAGHSSRPACRGQGFQPQHLTQNKDSSRAGRGPGTAVAWVGTGSELSVRVVSSGEREEAWACGGLQPSSAPPSSELPESWTLSPRRSLECLRGSPVSAGPASRSRRNTRVAVATDVAVGSCAAPWARCWVWRGTSGHSVHPCSSSVHCCVTIPGSCRLVLLREQICDRREGDSGGLCYFPVGSPLGDKGQWPHVPGLDSHCIKTEGPVKTGRWVQAGTWGHPDPLALALWGRARACASCVAPS